MANRSPGPSALKSLPLSALQREIERRQSKGARLLRKRASLLRRIASLDRKIEAAGLDAVGHGPATRDGRRPRQRPRNEMTLVDALARLLKGKTMSVTDIATAVQRAGYRSSAANFRLIVNQSLIRSPKFRKVNRGQYTAK